MQKFTSQLMLGVLLTFSAQSVLAKSDMGQGRLFLGSTQADPKELNTELTAQGIKNVELNNKFGIEITFPTFEYLNLGLRYTYNLISNDETTADPNTDYLAKATQNSFLGVARVPFYKNDYVHLDVFAGVGVNNMSYSIKTASQDGKLEQSTIPTYAAGASASFGFKKYFVFFEGGFESNVANDLKTSGTINANVTKIDLTGSYFVIGLMFDGIPIFKQ